MQAQICSYNPELDLCVTVEAVATRLLCKRCLQSPELLHACVQAHAHTVIFSQQHFGNSI